MSGKIIGLTREQKGDKDVLKQYDIPSLDKTLCLDLVVGQDKIIEKLKVIRDQIKFSPVYKHWGSRSPKGILFSGEPGTGKTFTSRCFANEVDAGMIELRFQDIASHYVDQPIEFLDKVRKFVEGEALKQQKHIIVFIDEVDAFLPSRSLHDITESDRKRVNFFLTWMDGGMRETHNVTFVGATNRMDIMDPAALRPGRFTEKLEFKKLSKEDVCKCLRVHMIRKQEKVGDFKIYQSFKDEEVIPHLDCLSGADVEQIIELAILEKAVKHQKNLEKPFAKLSKANPEMSSAEILSILTDGERSAVPKPITTQDLIEAIQKYKASQVKIGSEKKIQGFCP